jgi:uncharacterized protein (TIGR03437 family)
MSRRRLWILLTLTAAPAAAAPFGRVVPLGGQVSDIALDEARQVLYAANFTANRIDVVSLASASLQTSLNVAAQPGSLSLSPDGRWLVVTHFGNFEAPLAARNALTLIDLTTNGRQTFVMANPPLGVQFGIDGQALVITSKEFLLFDPVTGVLQLLGTIENLVANVLPKPIGESYPANLVAAAMGVSGDGRWIYCLTDSYRFRYEVLPRRMQALGYTSDPTMGPRAVSVNFDGTLLATGWTLRNRAGNNIAQYINPAGLLSVGSHAFDWRRNVIYSQVPEGKEIKLTALPPPVLSVVAGDNLELIEKIELPENLAGRSAISADGQTMYSVSDSGVMFLPVGRLSEERRVTALEEDVVFRANSCDRKVQSGELRIADLSGRATAFSLSTATPGIRFSIAAGVTPATVRVTVDPNAMPSQSGTVTATVTIAAPDSVRIPDPVRLVINLKDPDQRGTVVNVPGKLVDLLADPARDRFYVLRQDKNKVLVFDGSTYQKIGELRTQQTPWQMAITMDRRYMIVGHDNAQAASVFDLDTLEKLDPIVFPGGHYPRSIAASGRAILAATRVAGPKHKIDRVDFVARTASEFATLGPWENSIDDNTALVAGANGSSILAAQADGNLLLYNASADSFTISRRDVEKLGGAYAASSFDRFVVGNAWLNSSLVTTRRFGGGTSAGFAFSGADALRFTAPGVMERIDPATGSTIRPTRIAEAPIEGSEASGNVFSRSTAILASRKAVIALTVSGFTVLPWDYDASTAPPRIDRVVNSADGRSGAAPGALVSLLGSNLSPINLATDEMPLPTALGESCLTVNGAPTPMIFVSPTQINAQLPFTMEGNVTMVLRTPGGVSDNFNLTVAPAAPGVFRLNVDGLPDPAPAIYNARNGGLATGSNPLKRGDSIVIYLTGMGRTSPAVEAGQPAPADPLSVVEFPPTVSLGGVELPLAFAGLAPGTAGVYQINAIVSRSSPVGMNVPLEIRQGGGGTSFSMRVIE